MTSSNGIICRVAIPLWKESISHRWIPLTKANERSFFYLRLNKRLSKRSRRRWFETLLRLLWRHFNDFRLHESVQRVVNSFQSKSRWWIVRAYLWDNESTLTHEDVIKWKHFPRNWPFVQGIHRSPVNSPHKGPWRGALKFSVICVWINDWVNNRKAGDLRRHLGHYDVIVMTTHYCK